MKTLFECAPKLLIGVIHLRPLPGAPRWKGDMGAVVDAAVADARAYERGGAHALCLENFGDIPFTKGPVGPETVAAMAVAGSAVRDAVRLPLGFNVLRNDVCSGLALCAACGGSFVRVNVHTGAMLTDQGLIEGNAYATIRYRARMAPEAEIFADVHVKHAVPLGEQPLEIAAWDTLQRGLADALIVSGVGTGQPAAVEDLQRLRRACPQARLLVGSGVEAATVANYLGLADGFIVASSLKRGGVLDNPVDARRVAALVRAIRAGRA